MRKQTPNKKRILALKKKKLLSNSYASNPKTYTTKSSWAYTTC